MNTKNTNTTHVDAYGSSGTSPPWSWSEQFMLSLWWDQSERVTAARLRSRHPDEIAWALGIVASQKGASAARAVASWL